VLNLIVRSLDLRWDLTEDKRYTLSSEAKQLIRQSEKPFMVTVLLEGEIPATFKGYRDYIDYYLSELRRKYPKLQIRYQNPNDGSPEEVNRFKAFLKSQGVNGLAREVTTTGEISKSELFPYLSIDDGKEIFFVDLLDVKRPQESEEEAIQRSQLGFESKFLRTLRVLIEVRRPEVHIVGSQSRLMAEGFNRDQRMNAFQFLSSSSDRLLNRRDSISSIIVVGNSDLEQRTMIALDQLALREIPIIWLVEKFNVSPDSIVQSGTFLASHNEWNFEDYLFKLGLKLQPSLLMDLQSSLIPQVVGVQGGQAKTSMLKYPFHPLVSSYNIDSGYPLASDAISMMFVAPIDTLRASGTIKKEVILSSSPYTKVRKSPVALNFEFLRVQQQPEDYTNGSQIVGIEVAGKQGAYLKRRMSEEDKSWLISHGIQNPLMEGGIRQVLISDVDFALPPIDRNGKYVAVGYNIWERRMHEGNAQFINNLLERLIYGDDLLRLSTRNRDIPILDRVEWNRNKNYFTFLLTGLPIGILLVFYMAFRFWRKRKYENLFS
jgi:ABC-2 type transport system permease protein